MTYCLDINIGQPEETGQAKNLTLENCYTPCVRKNSGARKGTSRPPRNFILWGYLGINLPDLSTENEDRGSPGSTFSSMYLENYYTHENCYATLECVTLPGRFYLSRTTNNLGGSGSNFSYLT